MSPVSSVQQGIITQAELAKLIVVGSRGRVEVSIPVTDDDQRDIETHIKGMLTPGIALQAKSSRSLIRRVGRETLQIHFTLSPKRIVDDPRFWYFFAYFDLRQLAFRDPVFLLPSAVFHKKARIRRIERGEVVFGFLANLGAPGRDKWVPYRLATKDVGKRVLEIIKGFGATTGSAELAGAMALPGALWAGVNLKR